MANTNKETTKLKTQTKVANTNASETKTTKSKTSKAKTNEKKDNKVAIFFRDLKKLIIKNKLKLIIITFAFPFGFLFAIQNRKSYLLAIIYLITTILSIIVYFTLYNFLYYYSA